MRVWRVDSLRVASAPPQPVPIDAHEVLQTRARVCGLEAGRDQGRDDEAAGSEQHHDFKLIVHQRHPHAHAKISVAADYAPSAGAAAAATAGAPACSADASDKHAAEPS